MRMSEANLFPVVPYLHVQGHNREVMSMSDYVHTGRRPKISAENRTIESRLMFCACYLIFLFRAIATRLMPWRETAFRELGSRESIFREASSAASVMVTSSFMGL
jgi:hypothetical protein